MDTSLEEGRMRVFILITALALSGCGPKFLVGEPLATPEAFPGHIMAVPVTIKTATTFSHSVVFVNLETGTVDTVAELEGRVFIAEAGLAVLRGLPTAAAYYLAVEALADAGVDIGNSLSDAIGGLNAKSIDGSTVTITSG